MSPGQVRHLGFLVLTLSGCASASGPSVPVAATIVGRLEAPSVAESSGLVASRRFPGLYWTHNDSGDSARLFAINARGEVVGQAGGAPRLDGIAVPGATNVDWEDIAVMADGSLLIGDIGNNQNERRDLAIYRLPEPDPSAEATAPAVRLAYRYPDQTEFPPPAIEMNFDAEALFATERGVFVISKNRGRGPAKLYRFETLDAERENHLRHVADFRFVGQVTAADATAAGERLVVLTYAGVYLFEPSPDAEPEAYLASGWFLAVSNLRQAEAIALEGDAVLITNEQRDVLRVPLSAVRQGRLVGSARGGTAAP